MAALVLLVHKIHNEINTDCFIYHLLIQTLWGVKALFPCFDAARMYGGRI